MAKVAAEGPVSAAVCSVLATVCWGGSATCETLRAGGVGDGTAAAGRGLAVARTGTVCGLASCDWTVGTHGGAGAAVGLCRLGTLPGDRAGLVGDGVALLVADGLGDGVTLRVGDGVGVGVGEADGLGEVVAVAVPEGAGDGSVLGVALGTADGDGVDGDGAVAGADGEILGAGDAPAGDDHARAAAAAATRTPRTAVRAPTNIRPPSAWLPGHSVEAMTKLHILLEHRRGHHMSQRSWTGALSPPGTQAWHS